MPALDHVPGVAVPKPAHAHKGRKPMKVSNHQRRAERYERNYGERGDAVRAMPCLLAHTGECHGPIEAAHATGRKMGGVGGDRRSLVPQCRKHHRKQHRIGAVTSPRGPAGVDRAFLTGRKPNGARPAPAVGISPAPLLSDGA